jgi:endogenous inhibitor of DNA gyrase (YacG/DUF329 family)
MAQAMLKNCSVCQKPAVEAYRPFCSARCADIDLGRWLGESYRVPTEETPPQDGGMTTQEEE